MLEKGTLIRVQTRTKEDVFGDCMYEVVETGLDAPEPERKAAGIKDGVKCVMLGGSGPAARKGFVVIDSDEAIRRNIAEGITEVIPPEKRDEVVAHYDDKAKDGTPRRSVGGTGCVEV